VWIHAASVGEAAIAFSMASEIKKKSGDSRVFVTVVTAAGLKKITILQKSLQNIVIDMAFLAPFDCPLIVNRFVDAIAPTSYIIVETELWPSLIRSLHSRNVPITIINAKLSRRALRRYMFFRPAMSSIVQGLSLVCVQSRTFSRRFEMLGVPCERIEIMGNIKFDSLPFPPDDSVEMLRQKMGIPFNTPIFVAGSTRPGEEQIISRAFVNVLRVIPKAVMILAPRHLNRVPEVETTLQNCGLSYVTRTSGKTLSEAMCNVLILDTMGELIDAFGLADIAFVGGSLRNFGGHNPLEPAAIGKPVLFGPYMEQTGSKELIFAGAALLVHDEKEITKMLISLVNDATIREKMGHAGIMTVERFKGTLARTFQCMKDRALI
jgi:3-deoxy-D-manno-octulosonic-acid transferase